MRCVRFPYCHAICSDLSLPYSHISTKTALFTSIFCYRVGVVCGLRTTSVLTISKGCARNRSDQHRGDEALRAIGLFAE